LPDYDNWSNALFDAARATQAAGFVNASGVADYNTTVESWTEQRLFVTDAPALLQAELPALAHSLHKALGDLARVAAPSTAALSPVSDPSSTTFKCGELTVGFDSRGAVTTLVAADGTALASADGPVGLYRYHTYDNEDFNLFMQDLASRVDGPGCAGYGPGSADDLDCKNFRKPNVSSAAPKHRVVFPTLTGLWTNASAAQTAVAAGDTRPAQGGGQGGATSRSRAAGCEFVAEMAMDPEAHTLAGAPEKLAYTVTVSAAGVLGWEVVQLNKRPTRLPEAGFFSFNPAAAAAAPEGWRLQVRDADPCNTH
jgi:hypothetical protein